MARKPKTNGNGVGHNSGEPLTDDERADLMAYFGSQVRAKGKLIDAAKAELDGLRDQQNALFSKIRAELRINRKDFEMVQAAQNMTEAEFLAAETKRLGLLRLGGLPVGQQLDLFDTPKDTVDEKAVAYAAGRMAGLRGDDPTCPSTIAPILRADWEQGWADGQKELGERLLRAEAFIAAKAAKKPELKAGADPDDDGAPDLEPETIAKKARDLKKKGWTEPSPDEAAFPEPVH